MIIKILARQKILKKIMNSDLIYTEKKKLILFSYIPFLKSLLVKVKNTVYERPISLLHDRILSRNSNR